MKKNDNGKLMDHMELFVKSSLYLFVYMQDAQYHASLDKTHSH